MFRLTTKVKIAAGFAAGALTLGAAGAYAASNLPITVASNQIYPVGKAGTTQLQLVSLNGTKLPTTLPASALTSYGACVSWFATNKNIALLPQGYTAGSPSVTISKHNYHGTLLSGANAWCKTQVTSTAKTDTAETQTPDATDTSDATDSATPGNGHANGHGKHARQTD